MGIDWNKKVTLKIESPLHGHQTKELTVEQAVTEVADQCGKQGKWLYCDGEFVTVNKMDDSAKSRLAETLGSAKDITLAGTLVGG
jgi:hypothetical protein